MTRTLTRIEVNRKRDYLEFIVAGNSFLHHMVRNIVGTVISLYKEGAPSVRIMDILDRRDREYGGITAPAYGLYLYNVVYDPPLETMAAAFSPGISTKKFAGNA